MKDDNVEVPQAAQQAPAGDWIERWYGSGGKEGYEGWSIVSKEGRSLVAYLGRGVEPGAVTEIVMAHNAAPAAPSTPEVQVEDSVKELINLVDTFAESRHTQGHWTYNTKSQEARNAVIAALQGE